MAASRKSHDYFQKPLKFLAILTGFKFIFIIGYLYLREVNQHRTFSHFRQSHFDLSNIGIKKYPVADSYERVDWNDYKFIDYERRREGNGENGKGHRLTDPKDIELDRKLEEFEGLNVIVSDKISVNRSVRDTRPEV